MAEFIEIQKKILLYKMKFHKQKISTTKNLFQRDLK